MAKGPQGFAHAGGSLSLLQRGIGSSWVDLPPPISIPRCTVRKTADHTKPLAFIRCNFVCDGDQVVSTFPVRCHDGGGFPSDQRSAITAGQEIGAEGGIRRNPLVGSCAAWISYSILLPGSVSRRREAMIWSAIGRQFTPLRRPILRRPQHLVAMPFETRPWYRRNRRLIPVANPASHGNKP